MLKYFQSQKSGSKKKIRPPPVPTPLLQWIDRWSCFEMQIYIFTKLLCFYWTLNWLRNSYKVILFSCVVCLWIDNRAGNVILIYYNSIYSIIYTSLFSSAMLRFFFCLGVLKGTHSLIALNKPWIEFIISWLNVKWCKKLLPFDRVS